MKRLIDMLLAVLLVAVMCLLGEVDE